MHLYNSFRKQSLTFRIQWMYEQKKKTMLFGCPALLYNYELNCGSYCGQLRVQRLSNFIDKCTMTIFDGGLRLKFQLFVGRVGRYRNHKLFTWSELLLAVTIRILLDLIWFAVGVQQIKIDLVNVFELIAGGNCHPPLEDDLRSHSSTYR